jgi:hypothetical protein
MGERDKDRQTQGGEKERSGCGKHFLKFGRKSGHILVGIWAVVPVPRAPLVACSIPAGSNFLLPTYMRQSIQYIFVSKQSLAVIYPNASTKEVNILTGLKY